MLNIYCISGGLLQTNVYLLEDHNDVILIDFIPELANIVIQKKYIINKIFLTHVHFDHLFGLGTFQKNYQFELCLNNNSYNFIKNPDMELLSFLPSDIILQYQQIDLSNAKIFQKNEKIDWKNHEIQVVESPGHSHDSTMFILKEAKSVFTGDTIFFEGVGRTDFPDSNYESMIVSIKNLFSMIEKDYILYPGHGPKTTVQHEQKNNYFIKHFFL